MMGGRGVIRTAAKFAVAGIRGVPLPSAAMSSSQGTEVAAATWDMDDWEVPDDSEVDVPVAGEDTPRVVYGGVPSFQEAEAATTELKHALDKIYLTSNSSESGGEGSPLSPHSEMENKPCVNEVISNPAPSNHALQAFQLLSESPEAQTVVASIACDPNIWNAMVQNPALQDFFQSQQTTFCGAEAGFEVEGKGTLDKKMGELSYSDLGYGFIESLNILQNVKLSVAEMVSSVSNYLQNMFGLFIGQNSSAGENTKANLIDPFTVGGTFMGLAVLVAMVIMLKRA